MPTFEMVPRRVFTDDDIRMLRDGRCTAVIDPGDARPALDCLRSERLELAAILDTHHYADQWGVARAGAADGAIGCRPGKGDQPLCALPGAGDRQGRQRPCRSHTDRSGDRMLAVLRVWKNNF